MAEITKKSIETLAELARLEFSDSEKERFLTDLNNILSYFKELEALDTSKVIPMTGGTNLRNVLRDDAAMPQSLEDQEDIVAGFPEEQAGYNKVPLVF